jgi:hypothetical protein
MARPEFRLNLRVLRYLTGGQQILKKKKNDSREFALNFFINAILSVTATKHLNFKHNSLWDTAPGGLVRETSL